MRTIVSYNIDEISIYSMGVLIISFNFSEDGLHLNYIYVLCIIYIVHILYNLNFKDIDARN